jgi:DNA-binding protein YbaB
VDPNQIVASYEEDIAGLAARAEEAKERIQHLSGTATSPDGSVTVTVGGGGSLQNVQFGPRADGMPKERLAAEIMATARRAQAQASQQVLAIMGPLVGEDSDAMRFVREQIPSPEEPEAEFAESYPGQQALEEEPAPEPVRRRPVGRTADEDDYAMDSVYSSGSTAERQSFSGEERW